MARHLAGASLTALPKDDEDIRPIAVGEAWRRVVSKCLCAKSRDDARGALWPLQVGVASPLGAAAEVHTVQQYMQRHRLSRQKVVLTIDFANASNTVDRSALLRACHDRLPALEA